MLDELAQLGAGPCHVGKSGQRLHSQFHSRQCGVIEVTDELDSGGWNPAGLDDTTRSTFWHLHGFTRASDSRNKIKGAAVLQVRDLLIPIVGARAIVAAAKIGTRNKTRVAFDLQVRLKCVALISALSGRTAIHEEHAHGPRALGQPAVAVLRNRPRTGDQTQATAARYWEGNQLAVRVG